MSMNGTAPKPTKPMKSTKPTFTLEYEIRPVQPDSLKLLRHEVLWPSILPGEQLSDFDYQEGTLHLGLFLPSTQLRSLSIPESYDNLPVGIVTLVPTPYTRPLPPALQQALISPRSDSQQALQPSRSESLCNKSPHTDSTEPQQGRTSWTGEPATQLRKFALHPSLQGQGLGRTMFHACLDALRQETTPRLLHLDARTEQRGFYRRLGLVELDGETFDKVGPNGDGPAIPHIRMGLVIT